MGDAEKPSEADLERERAEEGSDAAMAREARERAEEGAEEDEPKYGGKAPRRHDDDEEAPPADAGEPE